MNEVLHPRDSSIASPALLSLARLLAAVGWLSLILQFFLSIDYQLQRGHDVAYGVFMYAGYFTILTNLFCALVATAFAIRVDANSKWIAWRTPWVVTAAAVAIVMVGAIFHVMLRHTYQPQGLAVLTNLLHHYAIPVVFPVLWWLTVRRGSVDWSDLTRVFAYPAAYLVYIVLRGEVSGIYPYPFLDVPQIGYTQVLMNSAGISLIFIVTGLAFIAIKR